MHQLNSEPAEICFVILWQQRKTIFVLKHIIEDRTDRHFVTDAYAVAFCPNAADLLQRQIKSIKLDRISCLNGHVPPVFAPLDLQTLKIHREDNVVLIEINANGVKRREFDFNLMRFLVQRLQVSANFGLQMGQ